MDEIDGPGRCSCSHAYLCSLTLASNVGSHPSLWSHKSSLLDTSRLLLKLNDPHDMIVSTLSFRSRMLH